jgi:hypothetical protein
VSDYVHGHQPGRRKYRDNCESEDVGRIGRVMRVQAWTVQVGDDDTGEVL